MRYLFFNRSALIFINIYLLFKYNITKSSIIIIIFFNEKLTINVIFHTYHHTKTQTQILMRKYSGRYR